MSISREQGAAFDFLVCWNIIQSSLRQSQATGWGFPIHWDHWDWRSGASKYWTGAFCIWPLPFWVVLGLLPERLEDELNSAAGISTIKCRSLCWAFSLYQRCCTEWCNKTCISVLATSCHLILATLAVAWKLEPDFPTFSSLPAHPWGTSSVKVLWKFATKCRIDHVSVLSPHWDKFVKILYIPPFFLAQVQNLPPVYGIENSLRRLSPN